jgi:protein-disulfide isomerase
MRFSVLGGLFMALSMALFLATPPATAAEFNESQKDEIEGIIGDYLKENPDFIREYLLNNPEILLEVSDKLRTMQIQQERESAALALSTHNEKLERHPMTPVTGNPDGDVTLIEFFDYNCSFCKRVFSFIQEIEEADPNLRLVWKEYPILASRAASSLTAAKVAMAAHRQDKYIEVHNALMGARSLASEEQIFQLIKDIGLDMDKLKEDMNSPEIKAYIAETLQMGDALKFQGTPTFVINGAVIGGAVPKEFIVAVIAAARDGALKPGQLSEEDLGAIMKKYGS